MHITKINTQPDKLSRIYNGMVFIILIGPTIFALIQNRWFMGQYTIQMQVSRDIRHQYPRGKFSIGIYSIFEDIGYSLDDINIVIFFGAMHIILSVLYGSLSLGFCADKIKLKRLSELLFMVSAASGFWLQMHLYYIFIGIQQVTEITVQLNTPGIMLSVFEDSSFMLFRLSTNFHLLVAIMLLCARG
eukprot:130933_1